MITVEQYEYVRVGSRVYGKSIRELSRETGHSRNTIRKVLRDEYKVYKSRDNQPYPVLDPYKAIIDQWLKKDKDRPKKQRHTARRIYNRLVEEEGYQGSESTVRRYVRQAKALFGLKRSGAFIPLVPDVGQEAEVDWGQANVIIGGHMEACKFFCMRSIWQDFCSILPCRETAMSF
ncbi:transposase [Desulfonatronovibrio hydrogenovorans]|uniref:transposase n=1 Tax=Desulfonatronovibrio hydrogenovorans TaxID=53245 RepID=UPI000ACEE563|nr:transposase [Desulfonatronovibrio hydrogenovorans]